MTSSQPATAAWAIVVFACRESLGVLEQTLAAVVAARCPPLGTVDVIVNGNRELADALVASPQVHAVAGSLRLRVWSIPVADKANAWNEYVHHIWGGEGVAFFIDGYVRLHPDAVKRLGAAVTARADALGGTGVPTGGRTARSVRESLVREGGYHGNFCCLTAAAMAELRRRGIRLPRGLYRVDSLMGALISFRLRPDLHPWAPRSIAVAADASWDVDEKRWWRWRDLRAKWSRLSRQAVGHLENAAVRDHLAVRRAAPEQLPATAVELVADWARRCPGEARRVVGRHPLHRQALARMLAGAPQGEAGSRAALLVALPPASLPG